jgi:hypothetical protein
LQDLVLPQYFAKFATRLRQELRSTGQRMLFVSIITPPRGGMPWMRVAFSASDALALQRGVWSLEVMPFTVPGEQ